MRKHHGISEKLALPVLLLIGVWLVASCLPQVESTPMPLPTSSAAPPGKPATDVPISDTVNGMFENQISNLEESMPRAASEKYVIPTHEEQAAFAKLVSALVADDFAHAGDLAGSNSYRLNYYEDQGDNQAVSYLLREQIPIQKGWGVYAFRIGSTSNLIIEAPHPLADKRTPSVALAVFRALHARALLIAGAHRYANGDGSADVAHAPESIFQSVHVALSKEMQAKSGNVVILQIHGFHTAKHAGYPQAVFGFGENIHSKEIALAKKLNEAFLTQGLNVGLCAEDAWRELCGRQNVQGATSNGAIFIHIELDEELRKHPDSFIAALVQTFGQ